MLLDGTETTIKILLTHAAAYVQWLECGMVLMPSNKCISIDRTDYESVTFFVAILKSQLAAECSLQEALRSDHRLEFSFDRSMPPNHS